MEFGIATEVQVPNLCVRVREYVVSYEASKQTPTPVTLLAPEAWPRDVMMEGKWLILIGWFSNEGIEAF